MAQTSEAQTEKAGRRLLFCVLVPLAFLPVYGALGWLDTSTELMPSHELVLQSCYGIAGLAGVISGGLGIRESKGIVLWRRVPIVGALVLLGFLAAFLVGSRSADIIEGLMDFPPAKTRTFPALLVIWRAYQTHGKNPSWNIQTTPVWSNLNITEKDYDFMLAHRGPTDNGRNADEISSHGFFCARVTLQQAGSAARVLHAGSQSLPEGTVMVCPTGPPQKTMPISPNPSR